MKKTSLYLNNEDVERLRRLAEREGVSRAAVLRQALAAYEHRVPDRNFAMVGVFEGDGTSIADVPEDELLRGFGEDSFGE